jgi:hypothetical protein
MADSVTPSYTRLARSIKKTARRETTDEHYSIEVLMNCIEALIEICQKEYKKITIDYRTRRRAVMAPETYALSQYEACIENFNALVEILLNQHLSYVLKDCNLDIQKYQSSYSHHESTDEKFQQLAYTIIDQLKFSLTSQKLAPPTTTPLQATTLAVKIMNFQCAYYPTLTLTCKSKDLYPILKQTWLEDKVWQQFDIESEDYCNIKGIEKNPDFIEAAGTLQRLIEEDIMECVPETEIYQEMAPVECRRKGGRSFEDKYGEGEVILEKELAKLKRKEKIVYDGYMLIKAEEDERVGKIRAEEDRVRKEKERRQFIEDAFGKEFADNEDKLAELQGIIDTEGEI